MRLTPDQIAKIAEWIDLTQEVEIDCDEFLARVPALVETRVAHGGATMADEDAALLHHVKMCPECLEELQALLDACSEEE